MAKRPMKTIPTQWSELALKAHEVRKLAYAPYSKFLVGCAVEDEKGRVFTGCNVENASYPLCLCAERAAVVKMVSEGGRKLKRVALVTSSREICFPCGSCRQVLNEFGSPEVLAMNAKGDQFEILDLALLLPRSFSSAALKEK